MRIPSEVNNILEKLKQADFEAFIVGGCVRDILRKAKPKDWDITTNAKPEEIQKIFPDNFYDNNLGTVTVKTESKEESLKLVQVTPYRIEEAYTDKRHPDKVRFTEKLEEDLSRRDFTINAMAMDIKGSVKDSFGGQADLKTKIIRAVGDPNKRFEEDALRLMRAVRFAAELDFEIDKETFSAIKKNSQALRAVSKERVRDELVKMIMAEKPAKGISLMKDSGLLKFIIPELEEGVGVGQNKHHIYSVFDHNVYSLGFAAQFGYLLETRLAALLHDVGKPRTKRGEGPDSTFYGHDVVGAKMTAQILERLKFSREIITKVVTLVRYHLFYYNVGEVTESSVRRLVRKVGIKNIKDLINLRIAERKGSGVPKAKPYKLRHFEFMIEKALHEPTSVKDLKITGHDIMEKLNLKPGPKVGILLDALMNEVLEDPKKNKKEYLLKRIQELAKLPDSELAELAKEAELKIGETEERWEEEVKKKHYVE
ncbi:HD domain-containing protein [Candidatus Parcubacteria bacterium]|nr:MAG: HD domain-containing protein [Candidatus Parcubacteria bacterium]